MIRPAAFAALTAVSLASPRVPPTPRAAQRTSVVPGSPGGRLRVWSEEAVLGDGRKIMVEFKLRGPLRVSQQSKARCPECGPDWVRVIEARDVQNPSRLLARWEAPPPPTSIPWLDPQATGVWRAGRPAQTLITVEVPYGAKVGYLYAVQWIDGKLYQVGRVSSDAGFSLSHRRSDGALVIEQRSGASVGIPEELARFYVWDGRRFYDAGRQFVSYYQDQAASAKEVIEGPGAKTPNDLSVACRQALEADAYAGSPAAGATLCREALDRLLTERGVVPESPVRGEAEAKRYRQQLDWIARDVRRTLSTFLKDHPGLAPD